MENTTKPSLPFEALMITIITSSIIPLVTSGLSFNFSSFPIGGGDQDILLQGDAIFSARGAIQLVGQNSSRPNFGRVIYHKPLHLWDNETRNLTDFTTHYSFVVDAEGRNFYGDGFAFFLAPNDSLLPLPTNQTLGSTGGSLAKHFIYSWELNSTLEDSLTNRTDQVIIPPATGTGKKTGPGLVVGLTVGAVFAVAILGTVWSLLIRCMRKNGDSEDDVYVLDADMNEELERGTGPRKFSYHELAQATNRFKQENKLGEGGFGAVYKGILRQTNTQVAVKRVSKGSKQGIKEYAAEVRIITRLRHRNLVQLIGWCHEKKELLLVYEFLPNGSLHSHLFSEKNLLPWELRYNIAKGLASGLLYLHEEWEQCVLHRDIKASNIMLDLEFNAKLGDFGLAKLVDHMKGSQTTTMAGTMGYMAPECATTGKASKEADIYSFGVVILEIACGRRAMATENVLYIVEWVWNFYETNDLLLAADQRLHGDFNEQETERLMIVGLCCASPDANFRPSIRQAVHMLNFEAPVPILPSKMPVPTFSALPSLGTCSSSKIPSMTTASHLQPFQMDSSL